MTRPGALGVRTSGPTTAMAASARSSASSRSRSTRTSRSFARSYADDDDEEEHVYKGRCVGDPHACVRAARARDSPTHQQRAQAGRHASSHGLGADA